MTRSSDQLARTLGIKNLYKPGLKRDVNTEQPRAKQPPKREPVTRAERLQQAKLDATERQKRLYDRYVANQRIRLERLYKQHKPVRRYIKTLWDNASSVQYVGFRDADIDLPELARDVGLGTAALEPYDRLLILEHTIDWLWEVAKKKKVKREDFDDDGLWFEDSPPNAISDLKKELRLH